MEIVKLNLADINPDPLNTRVHDSHNLEVIKNSLTKFGQYRPFVIQKSNNVVRIGNGMMSAMADLAKTDPKWNEVDAVIMDLSDEEATALSILDNKSSDLSVFDELRLAEAIQALPEDLVTLTGFNLSEAEKLLQSAPKELQDGFADGRNSSEEESDTAFTFGQYRFEVGRAEYLTWQEKLRQSVGFDNPAANAEIKRRLGL